jgi:hypothetical protein
MYNVEIVGRIKAVTPWASGTPEEKEHGITLTIAVTVVDPMFFNDLGYGTGGAYVNALLEGKLPCEPPYTLRFANRDDVMLSLVDDKISLKCSVVTVKTSELLVDHWDVTMQLKCTNPTEKQAGHLTKLLNTMVYFRLVPTQEELLPETIPITVTPKAKAQQDDNLFGAEVEQEQQQEQEETQDKPSKKKRKRQKKTK